MNDLGGKLRRLREAHGLSQRELAKRVGVSNGAISQIENGGTDPTVGLLKKILGGLSVSVSEFFTRDFAAVSPFFFSKNELVEIGAGLVSYREVASSLKRRKLQILHERYKPGADTGPSKLSHRGEEGGLVLEGRLEVQVGDHSRVLGPGDAYQFQSVNPHRFRNAGDVDCVLVTACTPPTF
ncbi:MAG: cupin domain-containing protein [Parvularculaceae bacterium]